MSIRPKSVGRSIAAVAAGYVVATLLIVAATGALGGLVPELATPGGLRFGGWYVLNLAYSFVFGAAGGWVTARIAGRDETTHGGWLAIVMVVMGVFSIVTAPELPVWWTGGEVAGGVLGALLGARLRGARAVAAA